MWITFALKVSLRNLSLCFPGKHAGLTRSSNDKELGEFMSRFVWDPYHGSFSVLYRLVVTNRFITGYGELLKRAEICAEKCSDC